MPQTLSRTLARTHVRVSSVSAPLSLGGFSDPCGSYLERWHPVAMRVRNLSYPHAKHAARGNTAAKGTSSLALGLAGDLLDAPRGNGDVSLGVGLRDGYAVGNALLGSGLTDE